MHYQFTLRYTIHVLNFVGKILFLLGKKIRGVLIFVAMVVWLLQSLSSMLGINFCGI